MRAIVTEDFGAPPSLADIPVPEAGAGEVLVRVRASSLNGFDLSVARGNLRGVMEHRFPVVLGKDFAGTVEATGPGVDGFDVGDDVFGVLVKDELGDGAFGEYLSAPAAFTARVPSGLDLATAGAVALAGTAALDATAAAAVAEGDTVLVSGATGGAGAIAVQLVRARGVRVVATAGGEEKASFVRDLGADLVVDHRGDVAAAVRAVHPDGVDAVLHFAGDGPQLAELCRPGGRVVSALGLTADQLDREDVVVTTLSAQPVTETLERLAAAVVDGTVRVPIARTYALADVPQAFADFARGKLGKLAVDLR